MGMIIVYIIVPFFIARNFSLTVLLSILGSCLLIASGLLIKAVYNHRKFKDTDFYDDFGTFVFWAIIPNMVMWATYYFTTSNT